MSIYGTKEIDISKSIDNDTTLTQEEKEEVKETVHRAKSSSFVLRIGDEVYDDGSQADLFVKAHTHILGIIGKENMLKYSKCVKQTKDEFISYRRYITDDVIDNLSAIRELNDMFIFVYHSANSKKRLIDYLCKKFDIKNISIEVGN
jgi:hypothetical protein